MLSEYPLKLIAISWRSVSWLSRLERSCRDCKPDPILQRSIAQNIFFDPVTGTAYQSGVNLVPDQRRRSTAGDPDCRTCLARGKQNRDETATIR